MKTRNLLLFLLIPLFWMGACSGSETDGGNTGENGKDSTQAETPQTPERARTVEGETRAWESNLATVSVLDTMYPDFKEGIQAQLQKAREAWEKAGAISEEAQKIEQMVEANNMLGSGWMGELGEVEDRIQALHDKATELDNMTKTNSEDQESVEAAKHNVNKVVSDVRRTLELGGFSINAARSLVNNVVRNLDGMEKVLIDLEERIRMNTEANMTPEGDTDITSWTCRFCERVNSHALDKCGRCGARKLPYQ